MFDYKAYQKEYQKKYRESGKSAERCRAYYQRHKAEILERARERYKRKVLNG